MLIQMKEACGRGALALVAAAIINEFPVLGAKSKATGKRGKPCVSDLAILNNNDNSESTSKGQHNVDSSHTPSKSSCSRVQT